jgi:two-component system, NtrC family, nitrogen regulation response regulator NtrX
VVPIEVPPLRARVEDIPTLVEIFLAEAATSNRERRKTMAPDVHGGPHEATIGRATSARAEKPHRATWPSWFRATPFPSKNLPVQPARTPKTAVGELFAIDSLEQARHRF